jgi:hypothetical protein
MNTIKKGLLLWAGAVLISSCSYFEYDNYDAPDAGLFGQITDRKTGEKLQTEAGFSFKVEHYELSWEEAGHANTQSNFFWGKADGSFRNVKMFAAKYRISIKEGAFYPPKDTVLILSSGKLTESNYTVIPYGRVKIDEITFAGANNNDLVIKYTVEDTESEIAQEQFNEDNSILSNAQIFISSKSPNVGVSNTQTQYTLNAKKDISDYTPGTPKSYTERNVKGLPPGKYWLRVGVRTENPQKRFNFSEVQEIIIQ